MFRARALVLIPVVIALLAAGAVSGTAPKRTDPDRWFSDDSPFNQPIKRGAAVDAASSAMVANLVRETGAAGWPISVKKWSVPVYYADASVPKQDVSLTSSWAPVRTLRGVPVPSGAQPDPSSDGHMAIIDRTTRCFYEFYRAVHSQDGVLTAGWANRGRLSGTGIQPGAWSTRDSGFVNFAGLIRPRDLRRGVINHALVFSTMYSLKGRFVAPATSTGGAALPPPPGAVAIPYGARLRLDPSLDLSTLGLTRWQRVVARALQVYGMYLGDTGGFSLGAVNPEGYSTNPYAPFWGDEEYAYLPASLVSHLQVLKLGPLRKPHGYVMRKSTCGNVR